MMLLKLIKKGHAELDKKIGTVVKAFQVQYHPMFKSWSVLLPCKGRVHNFSFKKCVDHVIPSPEDMKPKPDSGEDHSRKDRGGRAVAVPRGLKVNPSDVEFTSCHENVILTTS
ncbi:hypothetical protein CDL15_Pgr008377 [Punica granatum]|uniref:Uncharacterized protein n=1 Tax=Punica granatum TaxID=22663 RepID=A0A218WN43_PUNGR|nr:hypothetical protein CDL15_Pgr008377 [Punica granatum]